MCPIKYFIFLSSLYALFLALFLAVAVAPTYAPLAPLPAANGQLQNTVTPSGYVLNLIKIGIGVASGLAVLAIAYSGIKYMMSDVVTNKSDAVQGIKNALLGLLLAISSYLILYTINPDLTRPVILQQLDQSAAPATYTPPPDNVGDPGGVNGSERYKLVYFYRNYQVVYQQYDWAETFYTRSGHLVQYRFETKSLCDTAGKRDVASGF